MSDWPVPVFLAAFGTIFYAVYVGSAWFQDVVLKRFAHSPRAARLYTFSCGVLAVAMGFGIGEAFDSHPANLLLILVAALPFIAAEVIRHRDDRRVKRQTSQVPTNP